MAGSKNSDFLKNITENHEESKEEDNFHENCSFLFWDFTLKPEYVALVVEGKELHVHRDILIKSSPVFQVMLESDKFIESSKEKIELPDKRYDDIHEMLNLIYPFKKEITVKTNLESLLDLSREYQIKKIKDICEKFLMEKNCSIDMLIVAQDYDLKDLLKKCIDYFSKKPLISMENNSRFDEINAETSSIIQLNQLKELQSHHKKLFGIVNKRSNSSRVRHQKSICCDCDACAYIGKNRNIGEEDATIFEPVSIANLPSISDHPMGFRYFQPEFISQ